MRIKSFLPALAASAIAAALIPSALFAQLPDFQGAEATLSTAARPGIVLARRLLAVGAVFTGIWTAFKAAKGGDSKGWITAVVLFVVAGFLLTPGPFFRMVGMQGLCNQLGTWGLCNA